MAAGLGIVALGFAVLTSLTTGTPYLVVGVAFAVLGAGMGITAAPATGEIMSSVPLSKAGVGSAVNDTTRELGGALGIALLGSIANSAYRSNVDFGGVDLPTGAAIVASFGVLMAVVAAGLGARALRRRGRDALFGVGIAAGAVVAVAGLLLIAFPRMDHHWLNWLEDAAPAIELVFLTPSERQAWRDSREALARGLADMRRLATLQDDVRWGRATLGEDQKERLRQFLAARGEITAGDRFVLRTLRDRARERQRYWLGVPMLLGGAAAALALRACRGGVGVSPATRPGRAARPAEPPEAR